MSSYWFIVYLFSFGRCDHLALICLDLKKNNVKVILFAHVTPKSSQNSSKVYVHQGRVGIWSLGFCGGRKTRERGEKPSEHGRAGTALSRTNNKLNSNAS